MLTGKQRSYLKKEAHKLKPTAQLGKEGISDTFIAEINNLLEKHELIKINVLESSPIKAGEAANILIEELKVDFVQSIGNKFVIYRESRENPMMELPQKDNRRARKNKEKINQQKLVKSKAVRASEKTKVPAKKVTRMKSKKREA